MAVGMMVVCGAARRRVTRATPTLPSLILASLSSTAAAPHRARRSAPLSAHKRSTRRALTSLSLTTVPLCRLFRARLTLWRYSSCCDSFSRGLAFCVDIVVCETWLPGAVTISRVSIDILIFGRVSAASVIRNVAS